MEISLHSNQKHIALGYYLSILKNVIMSPKTPFEKLYYSDLYCGDGECEIKKIKEKYDPPIITSILKEAKEGKFNVLCFLNDIDSEKVKRMREKIEDYKNFIFEVYCEDANTCYTKILPNVPSDQISLFFLDPYNHKHLKWATIKEISEHTSNYVDRKSGDKKIRRPELILNCMTYTMTGSYMAKDYKSINESLGTDEWLQLISEYKEKGLPVPKAFLDTLINQLKKLGYSIPTPIEIKSTIAQNDVYYLVWATNETGYEIIEKKMIPYLKKTVARTLQKNKKSLLDAEAKENARKKGDSDINNWI